VLHDWPLNSTIFALTPIYMYRQMNVKLIGADPHFHLHIKGHLRMFRVYFRYVVSKVPAITQKKAESVLA
jgi:hypothetical protein